MTKKPLCNIIAVTVSVTHYKLTVFPGSTVVHLLFSRWTVMGILNIPLVYEWA